MSVQPEPVAEPPKRGTFLVGDLLVRVRLDDRFIPRDDAPGRRADRFTFDDARAVADGLNAAADGLEELRALGVTFKVATSGQDEQGGRDAPEGEDFAPVFRRGSRSGVDGGQRQAADAHTTVLLRLPELVDWRVGDDPGKLDAHQETVKRLNEVLAGGIAERQALFRAVRQDGQPVGDVDFVAPNFVLVGAEHHGSGSDGPIGGPGAPPVAISAEELPVLEAMAERADRPDRCPFHVRFKRGDDTHDVEGEVEASQGGEGVIVVVLDAFPSPAEIAGVGGSAANELFVSLRDKLALDTTPNLEDRVGSIGDIRRTPSGGGEPYPMNSHGLFVAGLIHDIAPKAEIRLWRVLNRWGVGSLYAILRALAGAMTLAESTARPVVVNLSLCSDVAINTLNAAWGSPSVDFEARFDDVLEVALGAMRATDCVVVGAVGNGSGDPAPAYPARHFARLESVLAVAATNGAGEASQYTDRGHGVSAPAGASAAPAAGTLHGVATFGGEAVLRGGRPDIPAHSRPVTQGAPDGDRVTGEVELRDAVIGLLLGPFVPEAENPAAPPQGSKPNTTGWGYWAGTSFATPIISGLAACIFSGREGEKRPKAWRVVERIIELADEDMPRLLVGVKGIPARQLQPPSQGTPATSAP